MWPFISTDLNPLYPRILCAKIGWKWFWSGRFFKVVNVYSLCGYYLPLKKCMALILNKFEFSLPKNILCHVWFKLAQLFWRRFSKVVNIFNLLLLSPLRKRPRSFIWNCRAPDKVCICGNMHKFLLKTHWISKFGIYIRIKYFKYHWYWIKKNTQNKVNTIYWNMWVRVRL